MHCISISHKTAPTNIRQLFAFTTEEKIEFEKHMTKQKEILGCVVVSTCNRSEIYISGDKSLISYVEHEVAKWKSIDLKVLKKYFHIYSNEGAMKHLFQVASGLDSMVLGEDEILRQVKASYQLSLENKCTSNELNIAFQGAMKNAKLIKTDTKLSSTPISIGTLTVNKILEFIKNKEETTVLIVGITGKIGSIIAKNLFDKDCYHLIGTSRSHNCDYENLNNKNKIQMVEYKNRYHYIKKADVIVSATTSPHYTFTYHEVRKELEPENYHKLWVDLAVPYDIDKDIQTIEGMELIDIDYFHNASKENNQKKQYELGKAQEIMEQCTEEIMKNIYFQDFNKNMERVVNKVEEKGFRNILYQLKDTLTKEQLKALLDSLQNITEEE